MVVYRFPQVLGCELILLLELPCQLRSDECFVDGVDELLDVALVELQPTRTRDPVSAFFSFKPRELRLTVFGRIATRRQACPCLDRTRPLRCVLGSGQCCR